MVEPKQKWAEKFEMAPILYHLATDPAHARLREVNEQDIKRLLFLLKGVDEYCQLREFFYQALHW